MTVATNGNMLAVKCEACGKRYQAPAHLAGKPLRCKNCHALMKVPKLVAKPTPKRAPLPPLVVKRKARAAPSKKARRKPVHVDKICPGCKRLIHMRGQQSWHYSTLTWCFLGIAAVLAGASILTLHTLSPAFLETTEWYGYALRGLIYVGPALVLLFLGFRRPRERTIRCRLCHWSIVLRQGDDWPGSDKNGSAE